MIDVLQVHDALNKILPNTLVTFSIDTAIGMPMVRLSVRHEADGQVWQAQELFSRELWYYIHRESVERWFRTVFKDLL